MEVHALNKYFRIELEFVQSLANPHYLSCKFFYYFENVIVLLNKPGHFFLIMYSNMFLVDLAQRGYFKEETFVRYLSYLRYFKQPEYAKTLKYPQALLFLDLLQKPEFREAIALALLGNSHSYFIF